MKNVFVITALLLAQAAFSAADSRVELGSWDADRDGNVSLNEWDRNFEEKDVFIRLRERQADAAALEAGEDENLFAVPHLEEGYDANVSIDLFAYFDEDDSGVLEEDEFRDFAALLQSKA